VPQVIRAQKEAFKKEQGADAFEWAMKKEALSKVKADLFWKGHAVDVPEEMRDFPAVLLCLCLCLLWLCLCLCLCLCATTSSER
jgi:hypothetical protein